MKFTESSEIEWRGASVILLEESGKIATSVDYAFDPDRAVEDAKQDDVPPDTCEASNLADLGSELEVLRAVLDAPEANADLLDQGEGSRRVVAGDVVAIRSRSLSTKGESSRRWGQRLT